MIMPRALTFAALLLLLGCSPDGRIAPRPAKTEAPAGTYVLDPTHASLTFRVDHLGLSKYTARFTKLDARLDLDPKTPSRSQVSATVDPRSIETDFPLPAPDFDAELAGPRWLDAARHPQIVFRTRKVEPTGPDTARVVGDLTLRGVTKPILLKAKFNGGYARHPMDPAGARVGFSATGKLWRSDFGLTYGLPEKGSTFGVGDEVEILIEAEFTKAG